MLLYQQQQLQLTHLSESDSLLDELRLLKSEEELLLMRKAGEITCEAHIRAMTNVTPGMYEYQLEAEYLHTFIKQKNILI